MPPHPAVDATESADAAAAAAAACRYDELAAATEALELEDVAACLDRLVLDRAVRRRFAVHVHCRAHPRHNNNNERGGVVEAPDLLEPAVALERGGWAAWQRGMALYPAEA